MIRGLYETVHQQTPYRVSTGTVLLHSSEEQSACLPVPSFGGGLSIRDAGWTVVWFPRAVRCVKLLPAVRCFPYRAQMAHVLALPAELGTLFSTAGEHHQWEGSCGKER